MKLKTIFIFLITIGFLTSSRAVSTLDVDQVPEY